MGRVGWIVEMGRVVGCLVGLVEVGVVEDMVLVYRDEGYEGDASGVRSRRLGRREAVFV